MSERAIDTSVHFVDLTARSNTAADLSASEFIRLLRAGEITITEYVHACADRIEQFDNTIRAFEWFDRSLIDERVKRAEERWRAGGASMRMPGVPVGVKDIFNTYDMPTSMGSPILAGYTPGNDARAVSNIRLDGGLIAGKTVTAEFAVHHPGPTVNPYDIRRTPGTSSSGSASAVAARMIPVALASQTAGSIVRPASYCGVLGYKPSFGLIPRTGMLKTTDTLDTIGFIARTLDDLRLIFEVTRVRGHNYPVSEAALNNEARQAPQGKWRIGLLEGPQSCHESETVRNGLKGIAKRLSSAGAEVTPFRLPSEFDDAHSLHERIYRRNLAYYFMREWQSAPEKFSQELQEMIRGGQAVTADAYRADLARQSKMAALFDVAMQSIDVLLCPATADEAPIGLDAPDLPDHCLIWTMCHASVLSLPMLRGTSGLPVGVQLVSRRYEDYKLLSFADFVMTTTGNDA